MVWRRTEHKRVMATHAVPPLSVPLTPSQNSKLRANLPPMTEVMLSLTLSTQSNISPVLASMS